MPIYTIKEIDAHYVIAADNQDVLVCSDRQLALRIASAAAAPRQQSSEPVNVTFDRFQTIDHVIVRKRVAAR